MVSILLSHMLHQIVEWNIFKRFLEMLWIFKLSKLVSCFGSLSFSLSLSLSNTHTLSLLSFRKTSISRRCWRWRSEISLYLCLQESNCLSGNIRGLFCVYWENIELLVAWLLVVLGYRQFRWDVFVFVFVYS